MNSRPRDEKDFLMWRRGIVEHVTSGRMNFAEYGMFSLLCTLADPRTGTVVTNFSGLASLLRVKAHRIRDLCRSLRSKRYIHYETEQGKREQFVILINKYPLMHGGRTVIASEVGMNRVLRSEPEVDLQNKDPQPIDSKVGYNSKESEEKGPLRSELHVEGDSPKLIPYLSDCNRMSCNFGDDGVSEVGKPYTDTNTKEEIEKKKSWLRKGLVLVPYKPYTT